MDGLDGDYRRFVSPLGLLLSVPLVLVVIHISVPGAVRSQLAFSHDRFSGYTLLTWVYVHHSTIALLGSVGAYLLAAGLTYFLAVRARAERWFRYSFVAVLLFIPVLLALTRFVFVSILAPAADPTELGFVDVAAAYGGTMLVALWAYTGDRFGRNIRWDVLINHFLFVLVGVDTLYRRRFHPLLLGSIVVLLIVQRIIHAKKRGLAWWVRPVPIGSFSFLIICILEFVTIFAIVVMLYPADIRLEQQYLTTFLDTAGIWYGFLIGSVIWVAVSNESD